MISFFKKYKKIFICFIYVAIIFIIFSSNTYATDKIIQSADDFLEEGIIQTLDSDQIKKASDLIYNAFLGVGTVVVVMVGAVLGLQFIMGSVEEKAKVQEALIPYVIGSIIIFGAFGIWKAAIVVLNVIKPA